MIASGILSNVILFTACSLAAILSAEPPGLQPFPHVRIDREARVVEFDAFVPIDARTPDVRGRHPLIYLELIACTPDTREHESLVVTDALPSHVHAALLLIGLQPGAPGAWATSDGRVALTPPAGDGVRVEFVRMGEAGTEIVEPAAAWVRHATTGMPLPDRSFVFAGSKVIEREAGALYDADMSGTLIGLATFGTETLAHADVFSPELNVNEHVWIADPERTPPRGTPVLVRLSPAP